MPSTRDGVFIASEWIGSRLLVRRWRGGGGAGGRGRGRGGRRFGEDRGRWVASEEARERGGEGFGELDEVVAGRHGTDSDLGRLRNCIVEGELGNFVGWDE